MCFIGVGKKEVKMTNKERLDHAEARDEFSKWWEDLGCKIQFDGSVLALEAWEAGYLTGKKNVENAYCYHRN